eukprot:5106577-Amphidinium_carterae.2
MIGMHVRAVGYGAATLQVQRQGIWQTGKLNEHVALPRDLVPRCLVAFIHEVLHTTTDPICPQQESQNSNRTWKPMRHNAEVEQKIYRLALLLAGGGSDCDGLV